MNIDEETLKSVSLSLHPVDGRFDTLKYKDSLIAIDYAYDLDTIKNIIQKTKEISKGKIITVIGSGGEHHQNQRPLIGKFLTENTDYVIFTTDNPRYENEEEIINDLTTNLTKDNFQKITNRKEAIKTGIGLLENEDVLLILGKGHEDYQIFGSDEFPFKDRDEVLKTLNKKENAKATSYIIYRGGFTVENITLDKYQKKVIKNNSKNLLVIAGAGSGKTLTLVYKIKHLIKNHIKPEEILCITFTKAAAISLQNKLKQENIHINVKTFHSLGYNIIKNSKPVSIIKEEFLDNLITQKLKKYPNLIKIIPATFIEIGKEMLK